MGTKVQYTSYLPGFYTMRDLNKDADGSWSQYYDDKTLGGNFCNGYQLRTSNVYSEYDREMLKRTMLEHEAVFRKQVYELHRVYKIQKHMMAEMKKGLHTYRYLQSEISQSNSLSSHVPSEGTNRSNYKSPVAITDRKIPPVNFLNEINLQFASVSNGKGIALDGDTLNSMDKEHHKQTFDLQLSADVYNDCEEVERLEKEIAAESSSVTMLPLDRTQNINFQNDMKLDLGAAEGPRNLSDHNLVDLNEPVKEIFFGIAAGSVSANVIGNRTTSTENQGIQSAMRSITSFSGLANAFLRGRHCDEGSSSHDMHADEEETRREWLFLHNESGRSSRQLSMPGSYKQKFSVQSEQIQLNQKPHEFLFIDNNKKDTRFKPRLDLSAQLPSVSANAFSNYATAVSSPLLSSSFKATATENYGNLWNKWHYNGDLRSDSRSGSNAASYQNGFTQIDYSRHSHRNGINTEGWMPEMSEKDVHLNQTLLNGFLNRKADDSKGTCGDSSGALSWLKKKPDLNAYAVIDLNLLQGLEMRQEKENNGNQFNLFDLSSSLKVKESRTPRNEAYEDRQNSKKLFGFIIPEQSQTTKQEQSSTGEHNEKDMQNLPSLEPEGHIKMATDSYRSLINLNSCPNSPELPLDEDVLEAPSIDLEAKVASQQPHETDEPVIRAAAESIILISSQKCNNHSDDTMEALHCLAEVASSNAEAEMDQFELETLALEETKPEELWYGAQDLYNEDDQKRSIVSLLFTKPRRGQGKKRRHRREFQRDILPGLASLTRQEVTSDLQTIGGLMKASGQCWPARGMTRRNGGRGSSSRGRGGRRPRSSVVEVAEVKVSPVTTPNTSEVLGWGRTTRRCRRQRFPSVMNISAPLT